ncbi:MAG: endonuclease MutS2, partial [Culicoidibacterales bacterium]
EIHLLQARHPLIEPENIVPNDIILGKTYTSIVITGPNTGGKTVTLKTVGLLTLMAQAGLHIPAMEKSELAVFNHVFADIGDEQSIEQSLSTFSSHMKNIVTIIDNLSYNSLVLFDELGSGTDPKEGSSLAIEILEYMQKKEARVIATTHYPELKAYGYENDSVINASVEFDIDTLRPTYKLLLGIPGRSNAFEISKRLGLPDFIIDRAREHAQLETSEMTETIQRLESESIRLQQTRELAQSQQAEVNSLREEMKLQKQSYERQKQQMIDKAKKEANEYLKRAQQQADQIISDLKLVHAENVKEHELIAARTALKNAKYDERRGIARPTTRVDLQVGDLVKVATLGSNGEIMREIKPGLWEVKIGRMSMKVKDEDLLFEKRRTAKEKSSKRVGIKGERQIVGMKLDLRGKRFEEAMIELDHYLDKAVLMNYPSVSIIHGHGTGAIRKGVHEHLKQSKIVKTYRLGGAGEGGVGATVVEFK